MGSYPYGAPPPLEQLWREEVLYLHSLWHKGPPRNPNPKPDSNYAGATNFTTPKPNSNNLGASTSKTPAPNSDNLGASTSTTPKPNSDNLGASTSTTPKPSSDNLGASTSTTPKPNSDNLDASNLTTSKKRKNKRRGAKKNKQAKPVVLELEWPCGPDPEPCQEAGRPESNPQSDQATKPSTAEDQAKSTALYLQQKGLKACLDFFSSKVCSDGDEEEENLMDDVITESEEFKFFLGIFTDDSYLRSYYEKNWGSGEFCCLVCIGTGRKVLKKFKNCVALVQHSTSISKTKSKRAHRAFAKAICQILGWDIHRLPSVVLSLDGPLGHSVAKSESEVGLKQNSAPKEEVRVNFIDLVDDSDEEVDPKDHGVNVPQEDLQGKVVDYLTVGNDERMDIQVVSKIDYGLHHKDFDSETFVKEEAYEGEEMHCRMSLIEHVKMEAYEGEEMDCRMGLMECAIENQEEGLQKGC